jgi:cell division ATPase FtsA
MEDGLGAHVIVDIGERTSHLVLVQRGQPFFSRRLQFGGDDLTKAIAESGRIPLEEADEWKLAAGSDADCPLTYRLNWVRSEKSRAIAEIG